MLAAEPYRKAATMGAHGMANRLCALLATWRAWRRLCVAALYGGVGAGDRTVGVEGVPLIIKWRRNRKWRFPKQ